MKYICVNGPPSVSHDAHGHAQRVVKRLLDTPELASVRDRYGSIGIHFFRPETSDDRGDEAVLRKELGVSAYAGFDFPSETISGLFFPPGENGHDGKVQIHLRATLDQKGIGRFVAHELGHVAEFMRGTHYKANGRQEDGSWHDDERLSRYLEQKLMSIWWFVE